MLFYKKIIPVVLITVAIMLFSRTLLDAYVLKGPRLLELMLENIGNAKAVLLKEKLFIFNNDKYEKTVIFNEITRYGFPDKFRVDTWSQTAQMFVVFSEKTSLHVVDKNIVSDNDIYFDTVLWFYKDILLYRDKAVLQNALNNDKVDISMSSLGRYNNKIAYVLGAKYPDVSMAQIWLDKNTFRPFRWLIPGSEKENDYDFFEIHFLKWQSVNNFWYPQVIKFFQNDILIRQITVETINVNPVFNPDIFNIDHIKSIYQTKEQTNNTKNKSEELNNIKKAIEKFKKIYD